MSCEQKKTSLLVIGEAPGSKATKARELGVEIITKTNGLSSLVSKELRWD